MHISFDNFFSLWKYFLIFFVPHSSENMAHDFLTLKLFEVVINIPQVPIELSH